MKKLLALFVLASLFLSGCGPKNVKLSPEQQERLQDGDSLIPEEPAAQ